MRRAFISVISVVLCVAALALLVAASRQASPVLILSCLDGAALCIQAVAWLVRGPWVAASMLCAFAACVAAEALLLVVPLTRGGSWLVATGFAALTGREVAACVAVIALPGAMAAAIWRRERL